MNCFHLVKAMELARSAVAADNADDIATAFALYNDSLQLFSAVLQFVTHKEANKVLKEKMSQYRSRANLIQQALEKRQLTRSKQKLPPVLSHASLFSLLYPFLGLQSHLALRSSSKSLHWRLSQPWLFPQPEFECRLHWKRICGSDPVTSLNSALHALSCVFRCVPNLKKLALVGELEPALEDAESRKQRLVQYLVDIRLIEEQREDEQETGISSADPEALRALERRETPFEVHSAAAGWATLLFHLFAREEPLACLRTTESLINPPIHQLHEALQTSAPQLGPPLRRLSQLTLESSLVDYPLLVCLLSTVSLPSLTCLCLPKVVFVNSQRIQDRSKNFASLKRLSGIVEESIRTAIESYGQPTQAAANTVTAAVSQGGRGNGANFIMRRDSFNQIIVSSHTDRVWTWPKSQSDSESVVAPEDVYVKLNRIRDEFGNPIVDDLGGEMNEDTLLWYNCTEDVHNIEEAESYVVAYLQFLVGNITDTPGLLEAVRPYIDARDSTGVLLALLSRGPLDDDEEDLALPTQIVSAEDEYSDESEYA